MSYIGNSPISVAFLTDTFSGTGSQTAFTMTVAPANTSSILVAVTGVVQDPSTYSVSGTTLTFSAAPPSGTSNISVRYLGIPASGVTTTAYRTVTDTTATAGQTSFTIPSYTVGYVDVFRNGVRLAAADFTATTGTTVVLNNACTAGDTVTTVSFYVSSVLNALPTTGGTLSGNLVVSGDLTTTGNTTLGDATTDTLTVGVTGIVKDSSGNVGIGTSSPADNLHVYANTTTENGIRVQNANASGQSAVQYYNNAGTQKADVWWNNNGSTFNIRTLSTDPMIFSTNNTERMRFDSSGNLLVGTTTTIGGASGVLQVKGAASQNAMQLQIGTNGNNGILWYNASASAIGSIVVNSGSVAYNTTSDYRLKENIAPMTGALEKVSALKPVTYTWKATGESTQGFIAHELQEVCPDAVSGKKDAVDADGNPVYQGIDTSFLVATLTAAIQEQQAIITQLQADVAALKGKA